MPDRLAAILRRREVETMVGNAQAIRAYPDGAERAEAARHEVYRAMYRAALGEISEEQRQQILDILRPCCPELFASSRPLAPESPDDSVPDR